MFNKTYILTSGITTFILGLVSILVITSTTTPSKSLDKEISLIDKKLAIINILHEYNCKPPLDTIITDRIILILGDTK